MSNLQAYERNAYLTELDAKVLATREEAHRPYVLLDDTLFYPEGGGQPSDQGQMNGVDVLDVRKGPDGIRHFLAAPLAPGPAELHLDWARRFDHMQQHSGQHLLTALAQDRFGWATTAFHLGERVSDIELSTSQISSKDLEILEEAVAAEIRNAKSIRVFLVSPEEYGTMKVRSRGLPEGHSGDVRLVEIDGLDLNTCGGTHLRSTAELECLALLGTESLRGGTRVFFVAGGRVRQRMGAHERCNAALRTILGAPDDELVSATETKLQQLKVSDRRVRNMEEELAMLHAELLSAQPQSLVEKHFDDRDAAYLQRVARSVLAKVPSKACFLTATSQNQNFFLLAKGAENSLDVAARGKEIAALMDGKGGGSSPFFQGKAGHLANRGQALERLRQVLDEART